MGETFEKVATLANVTEELDLETDFLVLTPGAEEDNDDDDPTPPPPPPDYNPVVGTEATDILSGTPGDDYITGLESNDFLYGLAGNDILDGGAGRDRLFGGAGADQFVLAESGSTDIVYDFEVGIDKIALFAIDYDQVEFEEYRGSSVEVIFGSDSLILRGVAVGEIDRGDFIEDYMPPVIDSMAMV